MGVLVKLIDELNNALGITCIVVSHDVPEVLSIADYAYIVADHHVIAEGSAAQLQNNPDATSASVSGWYCRWAGTIPLPGR
ncbi:Probable phospholipid import ATP-binding protein MlaF [Serratia fonticola]|uniref:Probable phospholipid import ATP-binding protein MlaF n=1 Tax=Serratia fonticola TaxID=47917 RepID=A0A4U9W8X2_SERFO|nr:Probable phospholipid import ATP-binding protein MlaF [Serratia fonticola]